MRTKAFYTLSFLLFVIFCKPLFAAVERAKFSNNQNQYVIIEFLDDDLVHFEFSAGQDAPNISQPIYASPMIDKTNYSGPSTNGYSKNGNTIETSELQAWYIHKLQKQ